MTFDFQNLPNQAGRIALVTGSNSGIGFEAALGFAQKGCKVVLACRCPDKAEQARQNIRQAVPESVIDTLVVDLSELSSVRHAAEIYRAKYRKLDILVNNAGIMYPPYTQTSDGFESQMATNCFGPFLLTSLLIDLLPDDPASRITWISSMAHKTGKINFSDINSESKYSKMASYGQSKLACLMYALELNRRMKQAGKQVMSNCAHPGAVHTNLGRYMPQFLLAIMARTVLPFIMHPASSGVMPIFEATLSPEAMGGQYYGPQGFLEMKGNSGVATIATQAKDIERGKKLWQLSEQITGAVYDF